LFGESGTGKTVAQKIALAIMKNNGYKMYEIAKGGFTLTGLSKLFKSNVSEDLLAKRKMLQESELLFLEDLSDLTDYMIDSVISLITSFADETVMDYTTNEVQSRFDIGKRKRSTFGGTDGHYFKLLKSSVWNDKVKRRVMCLFLYYFPDEKRSKEEYTDSLGKTYGTGDMSINIFTNRHLDTVKFERRTEPLRNTVDMEIRNKTWRNFYAVIQESNSCKYICDCLAEGHAVFNNRDTIINEDYNFLNDFLKRFAIPFKPLDFQVYSYLIKKGKSATMSELIAYLEVGRKKLDREIDFSPLLLKEYEDKETGQLRYVVKLSDYVKDMKGEFDNLIKKFKEMV
jgi:hypothetical protein